MLSSPFALIGGIWLQYAFGFNMSVAVAVGYIALAGVSAEIGVLVLTFIDQEVARAEQAVGRPLRLDELLAAAQHGTAERVRPIVMNAAAITIGLLPIFWRSEEPRVGQECVSTCRSRGSPDH